MNSKIRSNILPAIAIAFALFCCVAVLLSLRAQQNENTSYGKLKRLPAVTRVQQEETQFTRHTNVSMDGNCVLFTRRDLTASQAPLLFRKQVVQNKNFLRQLKAIGFVRARYSNELQSWEFALP